MYHFAKLLYEYVYVVASPVGYVAYAVVIGGKLLLVGNGHAGLWVWIEIVVNMQSVYVVAAYYVVYYVTDVLAVLWHSGVEDKLPVVWEHIARMLYGYMA